MSNQDLAALVENVRRTNELRERLRRAFSKPEDHYLLDYLGIERPQDEQIPLTS